jgi:hypothetical protein
MKLHMANESVSARSATFIIALTALLVCSGTTFSETVVPPAPSPLSRAVVLDTLKYLRDAWSATGRPWVARYAGLRWSAGTWSLDATWPSAPQNVAPQAYYVEYATRPALQLARVTHDDALLDELAAIYAAYFPRFERIDALRERAGDSISIAMLAGAGRASARTLPWIEHVGRTQRMRECELCTAQFLHPVARLIRTIAELPPERRTGTMLSVVREYAPLIAGDELERYAYETRWEYWGLRGLPRGLVPVWADLASGHIQFSKKYQRAMQDRDLWIIATAAELLGAAKTDSSLLAIGDNTRQIRRIVTTGIQFLQTKRTLHPDTRDFDGQRVGSVDYFEGDFDDHPDLAYAGDTSAAIPSSSAPIPGINVGWDLGHAYRIPVFLRSLTDNRAAIGIEFPSSDELRLVTNQFAFHAFRGDLERPVFRNYLDGTDGWYRVNYASRTGTGYPPSRYCDNRVNGRPCLSRSAVMGWGLLAHNNSRLRNVLNAVAHLAQSRDPETMAFRDRYYGAPAQPFTDVDDHGRPAYPFVLFALLAEQIDDAPNRP